MSTSEEPAEWRWPAHSRGQVMNVIASSVSWIDEQGLWAFGQLRVRGDGVLWVERGTPVAPVEAVEEATGER